MNEKADSQHVIELSTVYFFEGSAPRSIELKDCGLPLESPVPGAFSAFYGYQGRQEGFMAAKAYADHHRLNFTAIDFLVQLEHKQNPLMMKPQDLPNFDFLAFNRFTRSMMDSVAHTLADALRNRGEDLAQLDMAKPHLLLMARPELFSELLALPDWQQMKVVVHPAKLALTDKAFTVGSVPHRHWGSIVEAMCRIDPIRVGIDALPGPKSDAEKDGPKLTVVPSALPKSR